MSDADRERLGTIAEHTLRHFEETSAQARSALDDRRRPLRDVFADINTATNDEAVRSLSDLTDAQLRELYKLSTEPAVARVVAEDENGLRKVYFVSRATPHRSPSDGSLAVSYRAVPLGRLASLPIGGEVDAPSKNGSITLTVLERAILRPRELKGMWDSLNSIVEAADFGPFTVSSFRELLQISGILEDGIDALDAALAGDRAAALVVEGLKRDAITKMQLRDLAILDQYQDEIFRLPINTRLIILGPPGTGKTTTLIKRLGLKLDQTNLTSDERDIVAETAAGSAGHDGSWIMFTPTDLLKQYIREAFNQEGIAAPEDRIQTWEKFRRDMARNRFNILRAASGGGQFALKDGLPSLQVEAMSSQISWFEDFDAWQSKVFWSDMRSHAEALARDKDRGIARLGSQMLRALPTAASGLRVQAFPTLAEHTGQVQATISNLKETTDSAIRAAIAQEFKANPDFLNQLVAFVATLTDVEENDDPDIEDEEETRHIRIGREAAVDALSRALRAKARAVFSGRSLGAKTRSGRLIEWFGKRGPTQETLRMLGSNLQVQTSARRFLNPVQRLIDGMPSRYRRYRRERQSEGRWYNPDGFSATDLNPLEVDVILLAIIKTSRALLAERRIARDAGEGAYASLGPMMEACYTQVLVDEATDFSPVQLSCMVGLCDPASQSFVACGDFNQRITEWGSRSDGDLKWALPDIDVRSVSITYRHSRQLNELARAIALISSPEIPSAQLPQRVSNDGFEPVLAKGLRDRLTTADWLGSRIAEIERLTDTLPSIAVLVSDESEVIPMAEALNATLAADNIRAVPCPFGQLAGQDNDVRVVDVRHIKGLEFEAVFFISIDRLEERHPELFEKLGCCRSRGRRVKLTASSFRTP